MNGIVINMDPIMFRLGGFVISWHGFFSAVGLFIGLWLAGRIAARWGVSDEALSATAFWGVIGGIIGARLLHVLDYWSFYAANPSRIFLLTEGGIAIYGAILGGSAAGLAYAAWRKLPVGRLADAAAFGLILGQAIGRIGDLVNGEHWATETSLPWGIIYTHPNTLGQKDLAVHPVASIYEGLWDIAILGLLFGYRNRLAAPGMLYWMYLGLYSVGRFFLSFLRLDLIWIWNLREAQIVAIVCMALAVVMLYRLGRPTLTRAQRRARGRTRPSPVSGGPGDSGIGPGLGISS